jgi:hypothetical protein
MTTALYRLNGGEVIKVSLTDQPFSEVNTTYYGVLTNPDLPDGAEIRDPSGTARILGYAKFAEPSGPTVRNADQTELDNFPVAQAEDENLQDSAGAKDFLNSHPRWRKLLKGLAKVLIQQILEASNVKTNAVINQWNQYKIDVGNAASLADIKTAVAALPTINSDLTETATLSQFLTQIENQISEDD